MLNVQCFECSPIRENSYILYNEFNECLFIDPGCYFNEEKEEMAGFVRSRKLKPVHLLNTHCHLDHVFGNKFIAESFGLTLKIHEKEKTVLDYAPTSGLMYNLPFDNYAGDIEYIREGQKIYLGDDVLLALFTPGHSPGSLSFYCEQQNFVVSGDVLFQRSIGRTDLPGGDFDTLIRSVREQLFSLPDDCVVYSGHGPATTIGEEKKYNPFLKG